MVWMLRWSVCSRLRREQAQTTRQGLTRRKEQAESAGIQNLLDGSNAAFPAGMTSVRGVGMYLRQGWSVLPADYLQQLAERGGLPGIEWTRACLTD
jgi:hypothetical protein